MFGKAPTVRGGGGKLWGKMKNAQQKCLTSPSSKYPRSRIYCTHHREGDIPPAGYTVHITQHQIFLKQKILKHLTTVNILRVGFPTYCKAVKYS
jgi:hypothetical protein